MSAMRDRREDWWAPVWRGLVADPSGKHVKALGITGWMLLYVILHARRRTGIMFSRRSTIARRMGIPVRTVQRWLKQLERKGYVTASDRSGVATIAVLRWKSLKGDVTSDLPAANLGGRRARTGAGQ